MNALFPGPANLQLPLLEAGDILQIFGLQLLFPCSPTLEERFHPIYSALQCRFGNHSKPRSVWQRVQEEPPEDHGINDCSFKSHLGFIDATLRFARTPLCHRSFERPGLN